MLDMKKIEKYLPYALMCIAGLIAIFSLFSAVRTIEDATFGSEAESLLGGLKAILGGNVEVIGDEKVSFSFINLLAFFLPALAAGGFAFVVFKAPNHKPLLILTSVLLTVSFLLSWIFLSNMIYNLNGDGGTTILRAKALFPDVVKLGFGTVMGIIFSIIGLLASGFHTFLLVKDDFVTVKVEQ